MLCHRDGECERHTSDAFHTLPGRAAAWRRYFELTKPKVVALITFTGMVGTLLASGGVPSLGTLAWASAGIALAAASAATLNHVLEWQIDAQMARTRARPLPAGRLSRSRAIALAVILAALAMGILICLVNVVTAVLTFVSLIAYAGLYTVWLKHATPQNIVIGGVAGAMPPVLGWTAITGRVDANALLLFLIIFVWTPPHFWALAIARRAEYERAGIPMLPVTHGVAHTRLQILLYTILLTVVTLLPFLTKHERPAVSCRCAHSGCGFPLPCPRTQTQLTTAAADAGVSLLGELSYVVVRRAAHRSLSANRASHKYATRDTWNVRADYRRRVRRDVPCDREHSSCPRGPDRLPTELRDRARVGRDPVPHDSGSRYPGGDCHRFGTHPRMILRAHRTRTQNYEKSVASLSSEGVLKRSAASSDRQGREF